MNKTLGAEDVIRLLELKPLEIEGGYFRETFRASELMSFAGYEGKRSLSTAIYYLLTPDTFSKMHRVPGAEIFHFYLGDAVEMLQIAPDGTGEEIVMGPDVERGMHLQHVVPGGFWQGARLQEGGRFALMGTTMAPGFDYTDYESGKREELLRMFPQHRTRLHVLARER